MNTKKFFQILVVVAMVMGLVRFATPAYAAGVNLSIGPHNANPGDTFDLPIVINTDVAVRAYQVDLDFDPTYVQVNSFTDGGFLATAGHGSSVIMANPPTIDNVGGHVTGGAWSLVGGAGFGAIGTGNLVNVNFTVKPGAPNGRANLTMKNVILSDVNAHAIPGVVLNNRWIQVGPGPDLRVTALGFQPIGSGSQFNVLFTITNMGGTASDPDTVNVAATNATPASNPQTLPSLAAGASQNFTLTGYNLNTGAQNATVAVTIVGNGATRSATYSPVSATGNTPVDATVGAFLQLVPPDPFTFQLTIGPNSVNHGMIVRCNTNYEVDAYDNSVTTAWHMTEYNGTTYGALRLGDSFHVINASQSHDVTIGTPATLVTGGVAGQNGDAGQTWMLTFAQTLHFADPLLPTGETYHLVLTFNAYVTL